MLERPRGGVGAAGSGGSGAPGVGPGAVTTENWNRPSAGPAWRAGSAGFCDAGWTTRGLGVIPLGVPEPIRSMLMLGESGLGDSGLESVPGRPGVCAVMRLMLGDSGLERPGVGAAKIRSMLGDSGRALAPSTRAGRGKGKTARG